jgi:Tfp pilus assembly protein PilO
MSQPVKNSILLVCMLALLGAGHYYWLHRSLRGDLRIQQTQLQTMRDDYQTMQYLAGQHEAYQDSLIQLGLEFAQCEKVIPLAEDSKHTYQYLNKLSAPAGSQVAFIFQAGERDTYDEYRTSEYMLEGYANFSELYNFLWKLEHYRRLYNVTSLSIQEVKQTNEDTGAPESMVKFRMRIIGYAITEALTEQLSITHYPDITALPHNPFQPLVQEYIPPNKDQLLDVNRAVLQGLTADRAYITDDQGNLKVMKVGDKVYLGYLTIIDKARNRVSFTLNKGGFIEKAVLPLHQTF